MLGVVGRQQAIVWVGDRHQQIYEWRGAQNAMVQLPAKIECLPARIVEVALELEKLQSQSAPQCAQVQLSEVARSKRLMQQALREPGPCQGRVSAPKMDGFAWHG